MNSTHKHWFSLLIHHDYFPNQECNILNLTPVQDSLRIIKNYRIRFQNNKNEFQCFAEVLDNKKIWDELNTAEDLFFFLENTDPNFYNYTDIDFSKSESLLYYFTNNTITNRFQNEIQTSAQTKIKVHSLQFNLNIDKTKSNTIIIKHKGESIFSYTSEVGKQFIPINLTAFGTGVYELWTNNNKQETFFATANPPSTHTIGVVHLNMKNAVESIKENTLPKLILNFESRTAYREYVVVIPEYKKIEIQNISIDSGGNETYSTPEKKVVFEDHGESYVFVSEQPLKFYQKTKEHPILKIQYMNQFSDVLIEHDMKIPVPKATSIKIKNKNEEDTYYSQSIIYV